MSSNLKSMKYLTLFHYFFQILVSALTNGKPNDQQQVMLWGIHSFI